LTIWLGIGRCSQLYPAISTANIGKAGQSQISSEFFLMAIFSQTFLTLVRGNLMPFTLFTTGQVLSPPLPVGWGLDFLFIKGDHDSATLFDLVAKGDTGSGYFFVDAIDIQLLV
jgi:hypothetical protein